MRGWWRGRVSARHAVWPLLLSAAVLLCWIPTLASDLRASGVPRFEQLSWVGLDLAELTGLVLTAIGVGSRRPWLPSVATLTACLFLADAAVDLATAPTTSAQTSAVLMALFAELPLAALCLALAGSSPASQRLIPDRSRQAGVAHPL